MTDVAHTLRRGPRAGSLESREDPFQGIVEAL
jgi:hypothetical protein